MKRTITGDEQQALSYSAHETYKAFNTAHELPEDALWGIPEMLTFLEEFLGDDFHFMVNIDASSPGNFVYGIVPGILQISSVSRDNLVDALWWVVAKCLEVGPDIIATPNQKELRNY